MFSQAEQSPLPFPVFPSMHLWTPAFDGLAFSSSVTNFSVPWPASGVTTFYSLSLATLDQDTWAKNMAPRRSLNCYLGLSTERSPNEGALPESFPHVLSASSCRRWQRMSSPTLCTITAHWAPAFLISLVPDHRARAAICDSFQHVQPLLRERPSVCPWTHLYLSFLWLSDCWPENEFLRPLWGVGALRSGCGTTYLSRTRTLSWGFERLVISIITSFWLLRLTTWAVPEYIIIINWWVRVLQIWLYDMCSAISPSLWLLGNS